MHTNPLGHAETRSISIAAPPETVLEFVSDARRLPDWAPAFASLEYGTVDLLRVKDPARGTRMRVLNNEDGSEFLFTLIFPAGADDESIAQQMTTVDAELRTVRDRCEAQASGVA
jgi:Polyketide cyclase / dehydrase and lipid transport